MLTYVYFYAIHTFITWLLRQDDTSILCKIRKIRNKIRRHSITCSHIWYFDISVLICQYSVLMRYNQWKFGGDSTIQTWIVNNNVWKCPKKRNKIKGPSITCKMCILIRHTFCESLVMICTTKQKCCSFLWYYFSDIGQCCRLAQKNGFENQKSGSVRINYDNIPNFWWIFQTST